AAQTHSDVRMSAAHDGRRDPPQHPEATALTGPAPPPTRRRNPHARRRHRVMRILIIARPYAFHGGVGSATAGLMRALVAYGHDVHRAGPGRQSPQIGVTEHPLPLPPLPSAARGLALALAAVVVARRRGWDVVQSHERTLVQDVYRAGEGCHRAYLEAIGASAGR